MNNTPIKMIYKENHRDHGKEVLVYDFLHDITDTFLSFALCWIPSTSTWITVPVADLTPVIVTNRKKKKLNE